MMNSYQRTGSTFSTASRSRRFLVVVTLAALIFMGADWFLEGALRSNARALAAPLTRAAHGVTRTIFQTDFWRSRAALLEEIAALREGAANGAATETALQIAQEENEILRALLGANENRGITVPITSSFETSPYGTFTLGGGSIQGIEVGDVVVTRDNFVLGSIVEASAESSVARAVFAPGESTDVLSGSVGFSVRGRGGGNAFAQVPREAALEEGARVHAPAYANRAVGVIGHIESASSSAFADVFVIFPFNMNALRFVRVEVP